MVTYNLPDYRTKYFEHKDLDKVYGQPTINSIVKLLKQRKRNTQRSPTTLGGGQLGYISFSFMGTECNSIPGTTPLIQPTNPGLLVPIPNTGIATRDGTGPYPLAAAGIATQKLEHTELRHQYNEVQAVKLTLRKQIIMAIEDEYFQLLRSPITDTIQRSIIGLFDFLKQLYGILSLE